VFDPIDRKIFLIKDKNFDELSSHTTQHILLEPLPLDSINGLPLVI